MSQRRQRGVKRKRAHKRKREQEWEREQDQELERFGSQEERGPLDREWEREQEREWEREQEQERERQRREREHCERELERKRVQRVDALTARMPEELFKCVLGHMGSQWYEGAYNKQELGQCALVSTYWASRCQEKIFREITLRSAKDVRDLLVMLDRPGTNIAQYIQEIQLPREREEIPPYSHLVPLFYRKLPVSSHHTLNLHSFDLSSTRTVRTIHPLLPRTVPAHNTRLHKLFLLGFSFACFGDLVHLLDELRDLRILHCNDLRWAKGPLLTRLRSSGPRSTSIDKVRLDHCPLDEYALWLLSVYRVPPHTAHLDITNNSFHTTLRALLATIHPLEHDTDRYRCQAERDSVHMGTPSPPPSLYQTLI